MKKTFVSLLSVVLLLTSCATFHSVPARMESSAVLLKMKVRQIIIDPETGEKKERNGWGTCSGVYIKKNIILSAAHCVDMDEDIILREIWVKNNDEVSERAVVVRMDTEADLVLLYTPLDGNPVKFAHRAIRGQDCWVIGNPLGLRDVVTKGIVSQVDVVFPKSDPLEINFFIVDAVTLPGNSGGAVVDAEGHLIGILTRGTSMFGSFGASGLGLAVDLTVIRHFLKNNLNNR